MAENSNIATLELSTDFTAYLNVPGIIICTLGVVSNVLLIVAFIKDPLKCFRNSGTYLVMNLSVSDCLMCLISLSFNITPRVTLCPIFYFFVYWIGSASFVSITSISIDRFFMVVCPIKHRILMKDKFMILWIAGIWIMNCVIPLFQMLWDGGETIGRQALSTVSVIVIILSAVMYSSTYYKLKKQPRNVALQNSTETRAQEIRILKGKRFLKTIIIIACAAFVSTLPYLLIDLLNGYLHFNNVFAILYTVSVSIFYINFAVNPLIYILRLPSYRKTFYLLYCRRGPA